MKMQRLFVIAAAAVGALGLSPKKDRTNSTYYNPVIPGWHSDPSCVHVDDTFFCAFSTFLVSPGLPIYASKDMVSWKLASHAWTRPDQIGLPNAGRNNDNIMGGLYAPQLTHHDGKFYLACTYVDGFFWPTTPVLTGTIQTTTDPFNDDAWSNALNFDAPDIDSSLFWDDDGTAYLLSAGIRLQTINLETGSVNEPIFIWNGTGGATPEGPHIYKRDGWYYLLIGEGGTELGHRATIARSRNATGPYTSDPANPLITAANTTNYFQTVGHCDVFQDNENRDWAMCLATRSSPEWEIYPMGREAVLVPVSWRQGEWPVFSPAQGVMSGWPLPPYSQDLPGLGSFVGGSDEYAFPPGTDMPSNLVHWRYPQEGAYAISPPQHPYSLRITPSRANLTGVVWSEDFALTGKTGISFVGRRQEHTLFTYGTDINFDPHTSEQEAGITAYLAQLNHIDLGIGIANKTSQHSKYAAREFRFRIETAGTVNSTIPSSTARTTVPASWPANGAIHLQIHTANDTHYVFSAWPAENPNDKLIIGYASALVVSGGSGPFTGTLLGAYATCNGAGSVNSTTCPNASDAYVSGWGYNGAAQKIAAHEYVPVY